MKPTKLIASTVSAFCLLAVCGCASTESSSHPQAQREFHNPILFADYSDPDVIRVGKSYYLVASTFHFSPGLPVLKSDDLVHWTLVAHVVPRLTFDPKYDLPGPVGITDAS